MNTLRRRKRPEGAERKKPDGCRQEPGCGIRKDSHTETEADKGYFTGQDKTGKTFCHVRASEREQVSSVGIGKSHTPIMENTSSFILYQIFFFLSRPAAKSRSCAAADELPGGEAHKVKCIPRPARLRNSTKNPPHFCAGDLSESKTVKTNHPSGDKETNLSLPP